ncbi:hypothetical protein FA13DRAFT_1718383 [Coprinellus micaceus]|uniref:Uncharacterized protein n=1 Tax=Coprinellus micaceus TaxID=71717 RepID=A0A4Y7SDZ6_COPMI|nr:hypothetical protein FA13DRAFT_1718383 [Coprinellus micaceus]
MCTIYGDHSEGQEKSQESLPLLEYLLSRDPFLLIWVLITKALSFLPPSKSPQGFEAMSSLPGVPVEIVDDVLGLVLASDPKRYRLPTHLDVYGYNPGPDESSHLRSAILPQERIEEFLNNITRFNSTFPSSDGLSYREIENVRIVLPLNSIQVPQVCQILEGLRRPLKQGKTEGYKDDMSMETYFGVVKQLGGGNEKC